MGVLRTVFVVGALFAAMPSPPESGNEASSGSLPAFTYVAAAAGAVADLKDFCVRQPSVCETAGHLARAAERKARYSAKLISDWVHEAAPDSSPSLQSAGSAGGGLS
jgi:hypothetical protein